MTHRTWTSTGNDGFGGNTYPICAEHFVKIALFDSQSELCAFCPQKAVRVLTVSNGSRLLQCAKHTSPSAKTIDSQTVTVQFNADTGGNYDMTVAAVAQPRAPRKITGLLPSSLPRVADESRARQAADAFADAVGEDHASIGVAAPQWKDLLGSCVVVQVHCTAWRAETVLTLADLGIEPSDADERRALNSILQIGHRYLLPKRIIDARQTLENRLRGTLWRHALSSHWGHLVPEQLYSEWKTQSESIQAQYMAYVVDVAERWPDLMLEVETDYIALGRQNYRRLENSGRKPKETETAWVTAFVKRCMAKCESKEYWLAQARMWWDVNYIPLRSMLAEDEAEAAHRAAVARAKTEMERDVLEGAAKQFDEGITQFISDLRGGIADKVFNVVVDVLEAVKKNEHELPRNSSKQLRNLIEAVERLKFWPDTDLDAQMAAVRDMLEVRSNKRDGQSIENGLRRIGAEARLLLTELDRTPVRSSRHVDIPDQTGQLSGFVSERREQRWVDVKFELPDLEVTRKRRRINA